MKLFQGVGVHRGGAGWNALFPLALAPLPFPSTHPDSTTNQPLPRRSGILRMLLLAILTKMPKEAPKRPAPIVMVACVGRKGGEREGMRMLNKTEHDNSAHPPQPHHPRLSAVQWLWGRAARIPWTQRRGVLGQHMRGVS